MHCVDLGESYSNEYSVSNFGFDTTENELCKFCPLSVYRSSTQSGLLLRTTYVAILVQGVARNERGGRYVVV